MARNPREDDPGSWHHVMNRGIARRTLFESSEDLRSFLAALAWRVRAGELELHAWCLLSTHFHLLVRSPIGRLSEAMHRVQLGYSRKFNRGRKRDGPLVRNRFRSKPVRCLHYRRVLVAYIDSNPVEAGLVSHAGEYPWGSAFHYVRSSGPRWMDRSWIEDECRAQGGGQAVHQRYEACFGGRLYGDLLDVARARTMAHSNADPLDDLLGSAPKRVLDWMRTKARLADGTKPGLPVSAPRIVERALDQTREANGTNWRLDERKRRPGWHVLRAAALSDLCGLTQQQIGRRMARSGSTVSELLRAHRVAIEADPIYCQRAIRVVSLALQAWSR